MTRGINLHAQGGEKRILGTHCETHSPSADEKDFAAARQPRNVGFRRRLRLKRVGTRISMDGKGRCLDNIFIERLWRSLKYECVYLHAWETGSQAKAGIERWITFNNHHRPHTAHGGQPPAVVYFTATQTDQQVQAVA